MEISTSNFSGLIIIKPSVYFDERGFFMEDYHYQRYSKNGIIDHFVQDNLSESNYGVIRGLHYQIAPFGQAKLVKVVYGEVLDVAVDLRVGSHTFGQHKSIILSAENKLQFYIPQGFAHGYSVLSEKAVFSYKCSNFYNSDAERGICFADKILNIDWKIPKNKQIVSKKDLLLPSFNNAEKNFYFPNE